MSLLPRDVIKQAMVHIGELVSNADPNSDQMSDAFLALNTLKRSLFGTVIGPRLSPQSVSGTAGQAENGGEYQIPAGAFTLTAPMNPTSGSRFAVVDAGLSFAATPLTIVPNGRLIGGSAASLTLNVAGAGGAWWFRGDTGNWTAEADFAGLTSAIEFPDALIAYLPFMLAVVLSPQYGADIAPTVAQADAQGRAAFARAYGRRGRFQTDIPFGMAQPAPAAQG